MKMNKQAADFFRALADNTRLRCLMLLEKEGELCVCELTYALGLSQPKISRHLAQFSEAGIVTDRRDGTWIHYRINPALPEWGKQVLQTSAAGIADTAPFVSDRQALAGMPNRPEARCCT